MRLLVITFFLGLVSYVNATSIEKQKKDFSHLDESLSQLYKKIQEKYGNIDIKKNTWLKKTKNACGTSTQCLTKAYESKINYLKENYPLNIVLGRCHMDTCWWMKIENETIIKTQDNSRLIRFEKKTAFADFKNGQYPKTFPKSLNNAWGEKETNYVLCSEKLPVYIEAVDKLYKAYIPFDIKGQPSGATEGATNLYNYICYGQNNDKESPIHHYHFRAIDDYPIEQCREMTIKQPEDIFKHIPNCS